MNVLNEGSFRLALWQAILIHIVQIDFNELKAVTIMRTHQRTQNIIRLTM